MKKLVFVALLMLVFQVCAKAQCRDYIETIAESELEPYILDGNFESPIVSEGDVVTLNRTFLAGQNYKVAVCGMDMFNKEITITEDKTVLFKNYGKDTEDKIITTSDGTCLPLNGLLFYEFTPDHTMNLKIKVKVVPFDGGGNKKLEGCMGILVGFMK
ncbi:MAG: hypothetical protein MJZ61_02465 [Bacteroidales bacterium]|nr:hypothetical protein [Bacteroidales bacterium]